jgi:hypothetical protein
LPTQQNISLQVTILKQNKSKGWMNKDIKEVFGRDNLFENKLGSQMKISDKTNRQQAPEQQWGRGPGEEASPFAERLEGIRWKNISK